MNTPHKQRPRTHRQQRGASIIIVIAFYAVAMTLFGVWISTSLGHLRQTRQLQQKRQAVWLADSGLRRAVALLANDPNYTGEQWQLTATELGGQHTALIEIRIVAAKKPNVKNTNAQNTNKTEAANNNNNPEQLQITATALFPADTKREVRHTKSVTITATKTN